MTVILLALDSGIERTGFACFISKSTNPQLIDWGCIMTAKQMSVAERINNISIELTKLIRKHRPTQIVLEQLFFNHNQKTAIMVAQAQGATMLTATTHNIPIDFIAPLAVKQAVTGYGRSDKKSVEKMVMLEIGFKKAPKPDDVVDAIAIGIAYCSTTKLSKFY